MSGAAEARERLVKEDARYRKLAEDHQAFENRLEELRSRRWLSDEEKLEEVLLKKKKLAAKDGMESILRCAT